MPATLDPRLADVSLLRIAGLRFKHRQQQAQRAGVTRVTTDEELWDYILRVWGIAIPRLAVCPGHVAPFRAFADAFFARHSLYVWKASRGLGGKSFMLAVLGRALGALLASDVVILGGSLKQSMNVHTYMRNGWNAPHAPRHLLQSDPSSTRTLLTTGNSIEAITASQTSVRGPHPQRLLLDEVDEFRLELFDAAMGQTLAKNGVPACTVASSTHQHPDGTFTEVLKRAKERGWPVYEWCKEETVTPHGWLAPGEVARKKNEMTAQQWLVEVELQEPSGENRAIDPQAVASCFDRSLGEYEGKEREYIEAEAPTLGPRYAHGADWARKQDMTEIITLKGDAPPYRLVAYERMQRLPWPVMVQRLDDRITRYPLPAGLTPQASHDGTGLGDVVDGYLQHGVESFMMSGRARTDLFSECIAALERHEIVAPFITTLEAQIRYCTVDDLYGAGHPPDGFVALALAYHAIKRDPKPPEGKRVGWWGA